jgi:hypothetical protein
MGAQNKLKIGATHLVTAPKKLLFLFLLFAVSACMMSEIMTTYQTHNEFVMKDSWKDFLGKNTAPKVVLRVPDSPKDITQSEMMSYNSLYGCIEKGLLGANFTVRDRSLLKEVLSRAGGDLNYADIRKKIDTDFIVEIVSVKLGAWMLGMVSSQSNGAGAYGAGIPQPQQDVFGAILEGRVIMVVTGDVVGMFTIKELHPRPDTWFAPETDANGQPIKIASEALSDSDIEYLRTNITKKLIDFLKGLPVPDSMVTSGGNAGGSGQGGLFSGSRKMSK